ncbi:hypothetical protein DDT91_06305 [Algoriphagus sp. AK58]|nr:hypothetical protein [Algoriphagus sp. AK58]
MKFAFSSAKIGYKFLNPLLFIIKGDLLSMKRTNSLLPKYMLVSKQPFISQFSMKFIFPLSGIQSVTLPRGKSKKGHP